MSQRYNIDVPNCSIIDANFFLWFCLVLALADIYFAAELKLNLLITSSMATKNWNNGFHLCFVGVFPNLVFSVPS